VNAAAEVAMIEWVDGGRRLERLEVPAGRRAVIHGVVAEIVDELRRRMGATFTVAELVDEYESSSAWCLAVAQRVTDQAWAYDLSLVQAAAFNRFVREAVDHRP
jgi:hypothetical protein